MRLLSNDRPHLRAIQLAHHVKTLGPLLDEGLEIAIERQHCQPSFHQLVGLHVPRLVSRELQQA
jgi:hypothetical protein